MRKLLRRSLVQEIGPAPAAAPEPAEFRTALGQPELPLLGRLDLDPFVRYVAGLIAA